MEATEPTAAMCASRCRLMHDALFISVPVMDFTVLSYHAPECNVVNVISGRDNGCIHDAHYFGSKSPPNGLLSYISLSYNCI